MRAYFYEEVDQAFLNVDLKGAKLNEIRLMISLVFFFFIYLSLSHTSRLFKSRMRIKGTNMILISTSLSLI